MKQNKLQLMLLISILTSLILVGCNVSIEGLTNKSNNTQPRVEDISRKVVIGDSELYVQNIIKAIQTGGTNELFVEDFEISSSDIIDTPNIKNRYIFNNAIYLQINDEYMYRFQLNNYTKLIESYIKYQLEG